MQKILLSLILLTFIVGCARKNEQLPSSAAAPPGSRFGVKAGMAEMTMKMMGMETNVTTYWDDFGAKSVTEVRGEMMGMKMNETSIEKDGYSIKYDAEKKTGTKIKGKANPSEMNFREMTPAQMKEQGMTEAGTETIMGKECKVYEVDADKMGSDTTGQPIKVKGKVWVWQGIPVKMEMGDLMKMEATKLEVLESVPMAKFEIPADVTITESP